MILISISVILLGVSLMLVACTVMKLRDDVNFLIERESSRSYKEVRDRNEKINHGPR